MHRQNQDLQFLGQNLLTFVLVNMWCFFSKKINFMADLQRKYLCISAIALIETNSFGVLVHSFYVFCDIGKHSSAGYVRKVPKYIESFRKYNAASKYHHLFSLKPSQVGNIVPSRNSSITLFKVS